MYVNSLILQDLRSRLRLTEKQLKEQVDVNNQLKAYMGDVLMNVMSSNPQILEKNNKENWNLDYFIEMDFIKLRIY